MANASVVIVGGTSGMGLGLARRYVERGRQVAITGRDNARTAEVAGSIGGDGSVQSCALDLAVPDAICNCLTDIGAVDRLVLAAIERDDNAVREYDVVRAQRLVTLKLVGYTEVIHTLLPRMTEGASILLFGGLAMRRPYPGSTTITTVHLSLIHI